ncbi:hypothetical protein [Roseateles sp. PN1]|uniref:hypothetical protein n=1 Tax=Roseateles sp. PN1 TaxID=3137372 RepID=UPI003139F9DA
MLDNIDLIAENLLMNGFKGKVWEKEGKKRLYLENDTFTQYIELESGENVVKVFLKDKKFGDPYTVEDKKKCFDRRSDLVNELNLKGLGQTFVTRATPVQTTGEQS